MKRSSHVYSPSWEPSLCSSLPSEPLEIIVARHPHACFCSFSRWLWEAATVNQFYASYSMHSRTLLTLRPILASSWLHSHNAKPWNSHALYSCSTRFLHSMLHLEQYSRAEQRYGVFCTNNLSNESWHGIFATFIARFPAAWHITEAIAHQLLMVAQYYLHYHHPQLGALVSWMCYTVMLPVTSLRHLARLECNL